MQAMRLMLWVLALASMLLGCDENEKTSDQVQQKQQEKILAEGTAAVGMPAMKNFREKKILKDIYDLRDQTGLVTYTYLFNELNGKLIFFCNSIGYPIPYATQFSNPEKLEESSCNCGKYTLPQAEPNGLFTPASAEGTWVMCLSPDGKETRPVYVEPRLIASQYKLHTDADTPPTQPPSKNP